MVRFRLPILAGLSAIFLATSAYADVVTVVTDVVASAAVRKCPATETTGNCNDGFAPYIYANEPTFEGYKNTPTLAGAPLAPSWAIGEEFRWGDVIGSAADFDLENLTVTRTATNISFKMRTQFDGSQSGAFTSHLFLDTSGDHTPDTFNIAIVLCPNSTPGLELRGDTNPAAGDQRLATGLYSVTSYKTPADLWSSGGWGGLIQFCNDVPTDTGPCDETGSDHFALAPPVLATGGTNLGATVTWSRTAAPGAAGAAGWWDLTATVSGINLSLFDQFDVLATVADCANDALWGDVTTTTVPAPGALFLFGIGLLGIGAMRRRKAA